MTSEIQSYDPKQIDLIKQTVCKGASNEEFQLFMHVCKHTGLDPFLKQVYTVKRWDSKLGRETMTIQTGIDGYRVVADRTGRYAPGKETSFAYTEQGGLLSATAFVKKQTPDGTWHEVSSTAFFEEYCQRDKSGNPTQFWKKMGHTMLAKCAEAVCLRRAFPGDLSGLYTREEMLQSEEVEVMPNQQVKMVPYADMINHDVYNEMMNKYTHEKIDEYLRARSKYKKTSIDQNLSELTTNPDLFEKEFNKWNEKNKSQNQDTLDLKVQEG